MDWSKFWEMTYIIFGGIMTVAVISVIFSKNATTPAVLQNLFSGIGNDLGVAQAPITGSRVNLDLGYAGGYSHSFGAGVG